jgi:hypothetical protein
MLCTVHGAAVVSSLIRMSPREVRRTSEAGNGSVVLASGSPTGFAAGSSGVGVNRQRRTGDAGWDEVAAPLSWDDLSVATTGLPGVDVLQAANTWQMNASNGRRARFTALVNYKRRAPSVGSA